MLCTLESWGPLLNLLIPPDMKVTITILDIVSYFLQEADELHEKERLCLLIEEVAGIEEIGSLQLQQNMIECPERD